MLRLLYKKSGKISTKRRGGLIIRHGRIIRILRYVNFKGTCSYNHGIPTPLPITGKVVMETRKRKGLKEGLPARRTISTALAVTVVEILRGD